MSKEKEPIVLRESEKPTFDPTAKKALPGALENTCCEFYNQTGEDVTFTSCHPQKRNMHFNGKSPKFWSVIVCKPGEWVFLPHGLYIPTTQSGRPAKGVLNFGDAMFKGNKLPSRPEAKKIRVFNT